MQPAPQIAAAHSVIGSAGPQAAHIEWLWWVMLWVCVAVYATTMYVLLLGLFRRHRATEPSTVPQRKLWTYICVSVGATVLVLLGLLVSSVLVGRATSDLSLGGALTIKLTGYQWWWGVEYQHPEIDRRITTANEIHIPVGRPVTFTMTAGDVIHSFWVPNLHGKRDLIPGQNTTISFRADRPGVFRGQCAEFCGYQHAHMALFVVAEPEQRFEEWYSNQIKAAVQPATDEQKHGQMVFLTSDCTLCHTIRGTDAGGRTAPDLTHLKTRETIAAGTLRNTRGHLGGWIVNPQSDKPGNRMPQHAFSASDLRSLLAYLESLR
jgi:cytochrome c oxidase subunit 2